MLQMNVCPTIAFLPLLFGVRVPPRSTLMTKSFIVYVLIFSIHVTLQFRIKVSLRYEKLERYHVNHFSTLINFTSLKFKMLSIE